MSLKNWDDKTWLSSKKYIRSFNNFLLKQIKLNTNSHILDVADGKPVNFRTLDIGSDKILPYLKRIKEPNPALGWRALRVTLERRGIMRMQIQALIRGARQRPIRILFPFES